MRAADVFGEAMHERLREGVVQEDQRWRVRQYRFCCVGNTHADGTESLAKYPPALCVPLRAVSKLWVEFDSNDLAKGERAGQQQSAAFAAAEIDESIVLYACRAECGLPLLECSLKTRWRDTGIGGDVDVVGVALSRVSRRRSRHWCRCRSVGRMGAGRPWTKCA